MTKMRMSKEEYDQLYYYVPGNIAERGIVEEGDSPLVYASPRRYVTLDDARKAAIAKSKRVVANNKVCATSGFKLLMECPILWIYKGTEFLGTVQCDTTKSVPGLWTDKDDVKNYIPLDVNGCVI